MVFLLSPILRNVNLSTRKEVISWLMPKMVFYMPTVAAVTTLLPLRWMDNLDMPLKINQLMLTIL